MKETEKEPRNLPYNLRIVRVPFSEQPFSPPSEILIKFVLCVEEILRKSTTVEESRGSICISLIISEIPFYLLSYTIHHLMV